MAEHDQIKYDRLLMLVHPLYYPFYELYFRRRQNSKIQELNLRHMVKVFLREYGKKLIEESKNPKNYLIIVLPAYNEFLDFGTWPEAKLELDEYRLLYETPFLEFVKRVFGSQRVYITDYSKKWTTTKPLIPNNLREFEDHISVSSFGEQTDACVFNWTKELISKLKELGINVMQYDIDHSVSFPSDENKDYYKDIDTLRKKCMRVNPKRIKPNSQLKLRP